MTLDVTGEELIITNVTAILISAGNIKIKWTQNIPGFISITKNGKEVFTWNETKAGDKYWNSMNNLSGTYTFCVNGVCAVPFVHECISDVWHCELPLNGYEFDTCGNRRLNPACDASRDYALLVNGKTGSVEVELNTDITFTVRGAGSGQKIDIKNISALPDITECSGNADADGIYECTFQFIKDEVIEFQAYKYEMLLGTTSNIVKVTAGNPKEEMDYKTIAVYGIAALAGALVLSSILKSGD